MVIKEPRHTESVLKSHKSKMGVFSVKSWKQSHCGHNREGALFSWLHYIYMCICIWIISIPLYKCDVLHDLTPFVQFKKRKKHPWRSETFSKVPGFYPSTLVNATLLHGCFSRFLNCTNGTKLRNASQSEFKLQEIISLTSCLWILDIITGNV